MVPHSRDYFQELVNNCTCVFHDLFDVIKSFAAAAVYGALLPCLHEGCTVMRRPAAYRAFRLIAHRRRLEIGGMPVSTATSFDVDGKLGFISTRRLTALLGRTLWTSTFGPWTTPGGDGSSTRLRARFFSASVAPYLCLLYAIPRSTPVVYNTAAALAHGSSEAI